MSNNEVWTWEIAAKAAGNVADGTGHFKDPDFFDEIERLLLSEERPDVQQQVHQNAAHRIGSRFLRARNPRKKRDDGSLFDPGHILPLGKESRVFMDKATDDDLLAWAALSAQMAANVNQAAADRQTYVVGRIAAMRSRPGSVLGAIEREFFGYDDSEPELFEAAVLIEDDEA